MTRVSQTTSDKRLAVVAGILVLSSSLTAAHTHAASSQAFLALSGGARAYGMSGAIVALSDDASAVYLNPARLPFLEGPSATAGYAQLIEGLTADRIELALASPFGSDISAPLQDGKTHRFGTGIGIDFMGLDLSQGSRYGELAVTLSGAWAPSNFGALGANVKFMRASSDIDDVSANGLGLDLGLSTALHPNLESAVVLRNIVGSATFTDAETEDLVTSTTFALALTRLGWLSGEFDLVVESDNTALAQFGGELFIYHQVALRAGMRQWFQPSSRSVLSAGAGVRVGPMQVDYGAQIDEEDALGLTQRLTVVGRF